MLVFLRCLAGVYGGALRGFVTVYSADLTRFGHLGTTVGWLRGRSDNAYRVRGTGKHDTVGLLVRG